MKIVITGATGNVGTSVIQSLQRDSSVTQIVGLARRLPGLDMLKCSFVEADIAVDDLVGLFRGADVVIHLAWMLRPERDERTLHRVNVEGSRRVFEAAVAAEVPALVYASSLGTYGPGPKDRPVDESWSTRGIPTSLYSRQKVAVEGILDGIEAGAPHLRVVRLRPALIFKDAAASEIKRLFLGKLVPAKLLGPNRIPVVPDLPRLRFQCVHSRDVGEAYRLAAVTDVRGAFNIAAEPVLDPTILADTLGAKKVKMPAKVLRGIVNATYRLRLQPTHPGWVDLALETPIMSMDRAHQVLGWQARYSAVDALLELLEGIEHKHGFETPPLQPEH